MPSRTPQRRRRRSASTCWSPWSARPEIVRPLHLQGIQAEAILLSLRKLKGFDTVIKAVSGLFNERAVRLLFLGSAIRVDERSFAGLHRMLGEVGQVLDAGDREDLPEMYVANNPFANAMTIGMNQPIIVLNSSLLDLLDEEEMRFVVAHELGHALSGHAV